MKMDSMFKDRLINQRIVSEAQLISPQQIFVDIPRTEEESIFLEKGRTSIEKVFSGKDDRIIVIVGPCSIHDTEEAKEYSRKLGALSKIVSDKIIIVMRCYFEKPRTSIGWKGLLNDPGLDRSHDVNKGLRLSRDFLKYNADLKLLSATEYVSLMTPQYIGDFVSWAAIGARTSESPDHRSLASGLSVPVGFKNNTQGNIDSAINAVIASRHGHSFEGTTMFNGVAIFCTKGNPHTHVILRGGENPNYDKHTVGEVQEKLILQGIEPNLVIDCSHGNSQKDYKKQVEVFFDVLDQILKGNKGIKGIMIESYLKEGNQKLSNPKQLVSGISITDSCLEWDETEKIILDAYKKLKNKV